MYQFTLVAMWKAKTDNDEFITFVGIFCWESDDFINGKHIICAGEYGFSAHTHTHTQSFSYSVMMYNTPVSVDSFHFIFFCSDVIMRAQILF